MIEEVENMNVTLRNQAYETAWENVHKQRYIKTVCTTSSYMIHPKFRTITLVKNIQCPVWTRHQDPQRTCSYF